MADVLDEADIEAGLPEGWEYADDEITRTYEFDEYLRGVAFAQLVGEIAEAQFHHPEIVIRYGEVEISLTTHDAGGVTQQDLDMAEIIESETDA
ncbi:pterin-4-alpha-carbinolamine dehydratase [Salinarchaeum sp. Harcht-Bsk1]|uniref:4a-hydroxytetrahydrobiopterin dehydratase n=1 Tax=Salinarchaeum sp. Harcht-Bsk1 TaxID=1333523 RepID=UPI0003424597|nr:4a-hydroxytetrahydrobiopterin dehydratase [Salinarchaeum sp. Harcht-Bsk1]AGN01302.1 pterin-4-alpha-carbinolamine dehydratase [Salinarchaeum sp. Harcht-Bsk1]